MKHRILVISNAYPSSQKPYAGVFVKNQVDELLQRGNFNVNIFAMPRAYTGLWGSVSKYFRAAIQFCRHLPTKYELIHLHFFYPLIWLVFLYKLLHPATRIVVTLHGSDINGRFNSKLSRYLHTKLAKRIDYVQAVGTGLADEYEELLSASVDDIFPAGIDRRVFHYKQPDTATAKYDFIFIGSFIKRKGVDLLVAAVQELNLQDLQFCFIGSGPEEETIRTLQPSFNVDIFRDLPQSEIAEKLQDSRFFIFPTRYEPFGLVVTEALYCGVPAVVSQVGGVAEQVEDGINGIYIGDLSVEGVSQAMNDVLEFPLEKYSTLSENARTSNMNYSLESVVDRLESIYSKLLEDETREL